MGRGIGREIRIKEQMEKKRCEGEVMVLMEYVWSRGQGTSRKKREREKDENKNECGKDHDFLIAVNIPAHLCRASVCGAIARFLIRSSMAPNAASAPAFSFIGGSTSTTRTTALPSRTRLTLSASHGRTPPLVAGVADPAKASQKADPILEISV